MPIRSRALTSVIAATLLACSPGAEPETIEAGRLGRVELFRPNGAPRAVVFLISDEAGWSPAWRDSAEALRREGAAVVGIDLARYLIGLRASDDGCHYVVSELEALSKRVQRGLGAEHYLSPILAGVGAGGTLAYAALAQAPAATLAGAASVDPAPALPTRVPLCPGAPSTQTTAGFGYGPAPSLPGFWRVDPIRGLPPALASLAEPPQGPNGEGAPLARLAALVAPSLRAADTAVAALHGLPLTEISARQPGAWMAVIWSGDGGWRDIDKQIGEELAAGGAPVVGVDSLRYFWRRKTPEQVASDLAAIISHYTRVWNVGRVVLVGYSFGAGVLPFAVNRLPDGVRARVLQLSLLGLEPRAAFEFHVEGWLGRASAEDPLVLPELERIDLRLVQCFYGEQERETLCRAPELAGAERIGTAGGHHFDGDYRALARRIADGAGKRLGAVPPLLGEDSPHPARDQGGHAREHDRYGETSG